MKLKHAQLAGNLYDDITISEIKDGYCLLVASHSFLAMRIQDFQKLQNRKGGIFNHSGVFSSPFDVRSVFEATHPACCFTDFKEYINSGSHLLIGIPAFEVDPIRFGQICLQYDGLGYEYENLFIHQSIKFLTGKWIGRKNLKAEKRFICGELSARVYFDYSDGTWFNDWHKLAPIDLYESKLFEWKLLK